MGYAITTNPDHILGHPEDKASCAAAFGKGVFSSLHPSPVEVVASEPKLQAAEINASKQVTSWELTHEVLQKYCKSESVMGIIYL